MEWSEVIKQVLVIAGGTSVVISGLATILGKIWVGRILNREKAEHEKQLTNMQAQLDATNECLKAELERGLHIHRVQFEKEFRIYEELWSKLIELQKAVLSLRPVMDMINPEESEKERKTRRLTNFGRAIEEFTDVTDKNRPFYSEDVYKSMEKLRKLTYSEAVEYKHLDPHDDKYWDKAQQNGEAILTEIEQCCKIIRGHIGSIRVSD